MYPTKGKSMISVMPIILSILHAALHAEGSRYGGKYSRQSLKNEFPSFVFHKAPLHLPRVGEFLYSLRAITAEGIAGFKC